MVCPRRAGEKTFFIHEGPRRTATATPLSTEDTEGRGELLCNGNTFVHGGHGGPRRTATATHLSAEDTEGRRRRTATATPLSTKGRGELQRNGEGNGTFVRGGHGGPRRTATATPLSRRAGGPRRTATATPLSTEDTEGRGELQRQHICPRRAAKDREELQRQHLCPRRTRRAAENCNGDCNFLLSAKGREGTRRTATATPFVHGGHGGPRRTATATATSFCPQRATKKTFQDNNLVYPRRAEEKTFFVHEGH